MMRSGMLLLLGVFFIGVSVLLGYLSMESSDRQIERLRKVQDAGVTALQNYNAQVQSKGSP